MTTRFPDIVVTGSSKPNYFKFSQSSSPVFTFNRMPYFPRFSKRRRKAAYKAALQRMKEIANTTANTIYPNPDAIHQSIAEGNPGKLVNTFLESLEGMDADTIKGIFDNINKLNMCLSHIKDENGFKFALSDDPYTSYTDFDHDPAKVKECIGSVYSGVLPVRPSKAIGPYDNAYHDFFGTMFIPVQGLYYWVFGGGKDRFIHINQLNLSNNINHFEPVKKVLMSNPGPGTHHFKNERLEINAFKGDLKDKPAAFLIGRIGGFMDGKLVINKDKSYRLDATYWLKEDKYNADLNTNRSPKSELATQVLAYIGEIFGHTDYTIYIEGKKKVHLEGKIQ